MAFAHLPPLLLAWRHYVLSILLKPILSILHHLLHLLHQILDAILQLLNTRLYGLAWSLGMPWVRSFVIALTVRCLVQGFNRLRRPSPPMSIRRSPDRFVRASVLPVVVERGFPVLDCVVYQFANLALDTDEAFDHGLHAPLNVFDVGAMLEWKPAVAAVLLAALES